jgi:DNA-binding transcriptional LysR family regulator
VALEEAVDGAASGASRVRGRLRINSDAFFASHVLAPRLPAFLDAHPELELEVVVSDGSGNLVAEGFDLAIRFGTPQGQGLVARRLLQTRIVTCAAPAYLKRYGRPRHPRDLTKGHECILFRDPQSGRPFDWDFLGGRKRVTALAVRGRLVVNDIATALAACVAGQGIAQPVELGLEPLLRDGTLVELFPEWHDELFPLFALHPSRYLPPARVRAFLEFLVASTRAGGPEPPRPSNSRQLARTRVRTTLGKLT